MRLLLTFTTAFLFAALFSILPRNIIIKESKELNYTFVKVVPCISYSHHLILNMLKGRPKAIENRTKSHTTLLAYLALLVLTNANDIHLNPGPERDYLCGTCDKTVDWEDRGIICETCDQWCHAGCQNIHTISYQQLGDSELNISWYCIVCNNPNYSSTVHDYQSIEVSDMSNMSYSRISDIPPHSPEASLPIRPVHSSTPTRKTGPKTCNQPLTILNINFQSIKSKLCRLSNVIDSVKPDIIIGTETWLDKDIRDSEICPRGYILHRKDRTNKTGGGVLLAIKNEYNSEHVPELDTDCEIVWAKMNLKGNGTIYICSYYRRNVSDEDSLKFIETSVQRASVIENATIVIGGDMNLPGWDWKENILKPNAVFTNLHNYFMDIINNNALSQLIDQPTRLTNTLDLVLTNRPGKVLRTETIPGISDHDIVYTEFDFRPVKLKQKPRIIPLYNKVNWNNMQNDITSILDQRLQMFRDPDCNVNTMWEFFKQTLSKSAKQHIPQKNSKDKDRQPWINRDIKKNLKRLHRLFKKKKKTGDHQTQEQYNNLKHHTQKITRQAYWKYIENVVTPDESEPRSGMKKFWTYIKHKRKDIVGISSLKMDGKLYCDPVTKSNILNHQFKSAFSEKISYTTEEFLNSNRMNSTTTQHPNMKSFDITCNGITK